jgi:transcriptional regulator with XRE-family HTH domain
MHIGNKIKKLRQDHQMTQEQLAEKLHVTRNAVSKWETDKGLPNMDSLIAITKLFHISLDNLFSDEEIAIMTLENTETLEHHKNLIYALILTLVYGSIGILIPYYSFKYDPTSGLAVFAILLPISYILLGAISVLIRTRWPYVVIAAAMALTPIYIFFDSLPSISLGFWGIIYFIIYLLSYGLLSRLISSKIMKKDPERLRKLFLIISIIIDIIYVLHTSIEAITLYQCITCSAPWYTVLVINTLFYIVPIVVSHTLLFFYHVQVKRQVNL